MVDRVMEFLNVDALLAYWRDSVQFLEQSWHALVAVLPLLQRDTQDVAWLIALLSFLSITLLVYALGGWWQQRKNPVARRLADLQQDAMEGKMGARPADPQPVGSFWVRWAEPVGRALLPREGWQDSRRMTRLVRAGWRGTSAPRVLFGFQILLLLALPVLGALVFLVANPAWLGHPWGWLGLAGLGVLGFLLPDLFLGQRISQRRQAFAEGFPDVMDMLVVCVEAGLGLDAAIQRVGEEMQASHPVLASELRIMSLELRAGMTRQEALRGLAKRTQIDAIQSLSAILIQAEHFGTQISHALREHAQGMRQERIQRAREKAAKLPVKMVFPILLFIFPALFLVILGPAVLRISTVLFDIAG